VRACNLSGTGPCKRNRIWYDGGPDGLSRGGAGGCLSIKQIGQEGIVANPRRIGVVGAGLIGQGWATVFASRGCEVMLHDLRPEVLASAVAEVRANLMFLAEHELISRDAVGAGMEKIRTTTRLTEAVARAHYVQECAFDNYAVKKPLFREMDAAAPEHTILASSTSGLLMTEIQRGLSEPARCVLVHPFLPVHLIPLVEVAGGRNTDGSTLEATAELMQDMGKTPIVLKKEVPGYIVNRFQAALLREAVDLVHNGVASAEDVDKAFRLSLGLRGPVLGPLLRAHLAGDGMERFFQNFADSYRIRWESMASWTSIPPQAVDSVVKSVKAMKVVAENSLEAIKAWRDDMLVRILRIVSNDFRQH
jgi:3-hydroxypropionate dehydrogenase (NADP+)